MAPVLINDLPRPPNHAGKLVLRLLLPTVRFFFPKKISPSPSTEPTVTPRSLWWGKLMKLMSRLPLPKTSIRDIPPLELSQK